MIAADLVESCLETWGLKGRVIATANGAALENIAFKHPLYDMDAAYQRLSPIYTAEYVTLESGTGIVHSAPAYGVDDFLICKQHGLADDDILKPVMANGVFADSLALFGGQMIWKANPVIVETLQNAGTLVQTSDYRHSYMHCWRHKTPVIFRATSQWFAGMDRDNKWGKSLREMALKAVEDTQFYPAWGRARLHAMIANRPDWTLSRQRQWGCPWLSLYIKKQVHCTLARLSYLKRLLSV